MGKAVFLFVFQAFNVWFLGIYTWNEVLAIFILFVTQYAHFRPYLQRELCVKEWTEVIIRCCMLLDLLKVPLISNLIYMHVYSFFPR